MPNKPAQTRFMLRVPAWQSRFDDAPSSRASRVLPALSVAGAALSRFERGMPVCAHLLGVRIHRDRDARPFARHGTRDLAPSALPSLQPRRPRFRTAHTTLGAFATRTVTIGRAA